MTVTSALMVQLWEADAILEDLGDEDHGTAWYWNDDATTPQCRFCQALSHDPQAETFDPACPVVRLFAYTGRKD